MIGNQLNPSKTYPIIAHVKFYFATYLIHAPIADTNEAKINEKLNLNCKCLIINREKHIYVKQQVLLNQTI